jgi:hypothetical protein
MSPVYTVPAVLVYTFPVPAPGLTNENENIFIYHKKIPEFKIFLWRKKEKVVKVIIYKNHLKTDLGFGVNPRGAPALRGLIFFLGKACDRNPKDYGAFPKN